MSPDLLFGLSLAVKLVLTAAIVVGASVVIERAGPLIGALVVTLPVTVWPAMVFLSLDHDAAYIAATAQTGLAVNSVTALFMLIYILLAQKRGLVLSLSVAVPCWIALALLVMPVAWTLGGALLLSIAAYGTCLWASRSFIEVKVPRVARQWYELPLRAVLVCALMGVVLGFSHWAGPRAIGLLAVYPISTTCTMLIVHARIGGRESAAVIANGLWGMFGIGWGLFALSLTILPLGTVTALALALAVPVTWNLSVWFVRQRRRRARAELRATPT